MTKSQYLEQLAMKLRAMPEGERQDALEYYDGYISDAEDEADAITQLGSPAEVAAHILANYVEKESLPSEAEGGIKTKKNGIKIVWIAILGLFALPIGLPLAITLAMIPISLFIALFSVVVAVGASAIALFVSGVVAIILSPFVLVQDFGFGLIVIGYGLLSVGIGLLFAKLITMLFSGFPKIARLVSRKILRRGKHGRQPI